MKEEIEELNNPVWKELELCLVAQGYREVVFNRWICVLGSGFSALEIIKNIEKELK